MDKTILASIHPIHCEKIFHIVNYAPSGEPIGEKRFEVRKTRPRIEPPFKVYVYETKAKGFKNIGVHWENSQIFEHHIGKVIGEFICDSILEWHEDAKPPVLLIKTCLSYSQIRRYWGDKEKIFLWHISSLVIYDKPKELSEFRKPIDCHRGTQRDNCVGCWDCEITRPPQSWCYVQEI